MQIKDLKDKIIAGQENLQAKLSDKIDAIPD
jgi:hypothetical protein